VFITVWYINVQLISRCRHLCSDSMLRWPVLRWTVDFLSSGHWWSSVDWLRGTSTQHECNTTQSLRQMRKTWHMHKIKIKVNNNLCKMFIIKKWRSLKSFLSIRDLECFVLIRREWTLSGRSGITCVIISILEHVSDSRWMSGVTKFYTAAQKRV